MDGDHENRIMKLENQADRVDRVLFGDKQANEMGMKEKLDEIHTLLIQSRGVISFFGGVRGFIGLAILLGTFIAFLKGWINK